MRFPCRRTQEQAEAGEQCLDSIWDWRTVLLEFGPVAKEVFDDVFYTREVVADGLEFIQVDQLFQLCVLCREDRLDCKIISQNPTRASEGSPLTVFKHSRRGLGAAFCVNARILQMHQHVLEGLARRDPARDELRHSEEV